MNTNQDQHHQVVVVGARAAGASTAMLLARMGYDVALVDKAQFPSDTLSTHALARGGIIQLQRWGLLTDVLDTGAPAVHQVVFGSQDGEIARTIKPTAGIDFLLAPRRIWLDAVLVDAARQAGATQWFGTTVRGLVRNDRRRVVGVEVDHPERGRFRITADLVIIADGVRSRLAEQTGARFLARSVSASGTLYGYVEGLENRGFEYHLGERAFAGVFPTHDDQACVWLCLPTADSGRLRSAGADRAGALQAMITRAAPALGERLDRADWASPIRGAFGLPNQIRAAGGAGWALVGDAGYHRDPITGHGLTDAFRDADLLSCAVDQGLRTGDLDNALRSYAFERNKAIAEVFGITKALAEFPPPAEFVALQKRLSDALEREARFLAERDDRTAAYAVQPA